MRHLKCWIFIGIQFLPSLVYGECTLFYANVREDTLALHHFKKAESYVLQGDTTRAIKEFKETIRRDRKFSNAYHRLAQLYLDLSQLEDRVQARQYLEDALRFEPKNLSYLYTQIELFYRIRFYWTAERIAKKILKMNKKDARAYYTLGRMSEMEWLKYNDMSDSRKAGTKDDINAPAVGSREIIDFNFSNFGKQDLSKAMDFYKKAVMADSSFGDAYYRTAFICYEKRLYPSMLNLLVQALKVDPENKDYYLFLGLVYHRMNRMKESLAAYEKAGSLMQPDEMALFQAVYLVSTPEEGKAYRLANADEKEKMAYKFWKQRDPLFLTEGTERKLEHYGRVAYANLRFSNVLRGVAGWKTDQGNVTIRFGRPLNQSKTWPKINEIIPDKLPDKGKNDTYGADIRYGHPKSKFRTSATSSVNTVKKVQDYPVQHSKATWSYPGFAIIFEDVNFDGHYNFYNRSQFNDFIKKQPERYDYISPADRFIVSCSFASFREKEDRSVLEVYQSIPREKAGSLWFQQEPQLKRGVFLFDKDWREVRSGVSTKPFLMSHEDSQLIGWFRMRVHPGTYHLVVEFFDEKNRKMGRWLKDINVAAYDNRDLALSDLVLAWEIGDFQEARELRRGGVRIVPNTLEVYPVSSSIPLYFEIYNLTYSNEGSTHYRVTFTVQTEEEEKRGVAGLVHRLRGREDESGKVVTSYEYRGDKRSETYYQNLTLEQPLPQNYHISVEVEDLNTGEKVVRKKVVGLRGIKEE